jgi:hypothetical protein
MSGRDVHPCMGADLPGDRAEADVERALRRAMSASATPEELVGWEAVGAVYRDAVRKPRAHGLRLIAGLPASAAFASAMLLPAGAVAAAYTGRLPAHVQHWAHRVLAPVGVPAHKHAAPDERTVRAPSPSSRASTDGHAPELALAAPQRRRVVRLCMTLSGARRDEQDSLLSALHELLPREPDLHRTCRVVLGMPTNSHAVASTAPAPRRSPAPSPTAHAVAPTASPSPNPSPSGSAVADPTPPP